MALSEISTGFNPVKYGKLLAKALPKAIETPQEFHRCVALMETLDKRAEAGEKLTPEENTLLALLEQLVEAYDEKIELPKAPPHKMIAHLMEHQGLRQIDLLPIFGSRSVASDVLAGKREPSKTHIRKLADFFKLPADLFL